MQLWWQFFQIFVYGDVVYAQTWGGGIDPAKLHRASLKVANFKNQLFSQQNKIRATKVTNLVIAKSL